MWGVLNQQAEGCTLFLEPVLQTSLVRHPFVVPIADYFRDVGFVLVTAGWCPLFGSIAALLVAVQCRQDFLLLFR